MAEHFLGGSQLAALAQPQTRQLFGHQQNVAFRNRRFDQVGAGRFIGFELVQAHGGLLGLGLMMGVGEHLVRRVFQSGWVLLG